MANIMPVYLETLVLTTAVDVSGPWAGAPTD